MLRPPIALSGLEGPGKRAELIRRGRAVGVVANGIEMTFSIFREAALPAGMGILVERDVLELMVTFVGLRMEA